MERIRGPCKSRRLLGSSLGSGLGEASHPSAAGHRRSRGAFVFFEKAVNFHTAAAPSSVPRQSTGHVCVTAEQLVCAREGESGLHVGIAMDQPKHNIDLIFFNCLSAAMNVRCSCLHEQLLA